jgi:serine/threonine protein kinase
MAGDIAPILFKRGQQLTIVVTGRSLQAMEPRVHVVVVVQKHLGCGGMAEVLRVQVVSVDSNKPGWRGSLGSEVQPGYVCALKVLYRYKDLPPHWRPTHSGIWAAQTSHQVFMEWKALQQFKDSEYVLGGHALGVVVPGVHLPVARRHRGSRSRSSTSNSTSSNTSGSSSDSDDDAPVTACSKEMERACLLLELAEGGSLGNYMGKKGLPEQEVQVVVTRVARGLAAAAAADVIHRDTKPDNVLLKRRLPNGQPDLHSAVVADFGLVKVLGRYAQAGRTLVGTPEYATPDIQPGRTHTTKVDVCLLGYLTLHLLTGEPPFAYLGDPLANPQVVAYRTPGELTHPNSIYVRRGCWLSPLGQQCLEFLQQAICVDSNQRPSVLELLEGSPYLREGVQQ